MLFTFPPLFGLIPKVPKKSRQNDGYSPFWLMRALPFSALCNKSTIPDKVSKLLCRNSMTYPIHTTHGPPFCRANAQHQRIGKQLITGEVGNSK